MANWISMEKLELAIVAKTKRWPLPILWEMTMKKELVFSLTKKDFKIDWFSGSGAGGQHRNKHQNCIRLFHAESGVRVTGQSHKERRSNIREALSGLITNPKFLLWCNQKAFNLKSIDETIKEMMQPENLKVECREQDKWISCGG